MYLYNCLPSSPQTIYFDVKSTHTYRKYIYQQSYFGTSTYFILFWYLHMFCHILVTAHVWSYVSAWFYSTANVLWIWYHTWLHITCFTICLVEWHQQIIVTCFCQQTIVTCICLAYVGALFPNEFDIRTKNLKLHNLLNNDLKFILSPHFL